MIVNLTKVSCAALVFSLCGCKYYHYKYETYVAKPIHCPGEMERSQEAYKESINVHIWALTHETKERNSENGPDLLTQKGPYSFRFSMAEKNHVDAKDVILHSISLESTLSLPYETYFSDITPLILSPVVSAVAAGSISGKVCDELLASHEMCNVSVYDYSFDSEFNFDFAKSEVLTLIIDLEDKNANVRVMQCFSMRPKLDEGTKYYSFGT